MAGGGGRTLGLFLLFLRADLHLRRPLVPSNAGVCAHRARRDGGRVLRCGAGAALRGGRHLLLPVWSGAVSDSGEYSSYHHAVVHPAEHTKIIYFVLYHRENV